MLSSICTDLSFSALNLSYLKSYARSLSPQTFTNLSFTLDLSIWSSLSNCFLIWFSRLYPQSSMGLQVRSDSLLCIWRPTSCLPQGQHSDPIFYSTGTKHTSLYKITRRVADTILKWKRTAILWHLCLWVEPGDLPKLKTFHRAPSCCLSSVDILLLLGEMLTWVHSSTMRFPKFHLQTGIWYML